MGTHPIFESDFDCLTDPCDPFPCHEDADCIPTESSYSCECKQRKAVNGYWEMLTGDGESCFIVQAPAHVGYRHYDIDECWEETHKCSDYADCINEPGSYKCECKEGYETENGGKTCTEVNPLGEWGPWGACSATCGSGQRSRSRTCDAPDCSDKTEESEDCQIEEKDCGDCCSVILSTNRWETKKPFLRYDELVNGRVAYVNQEKTRAFWFDGEAGDSGDWLRGRYSFFQAGGTHYHY